MSWIQIVIGESWSLGQSFLLNRLKLTRIRFRVMVDLRFTHDIVFDGIISAFIDAQGL